MKKRMMMLLMALGMTISMTACGGGQSTSGEAETSSDSSATAADSVSNEGETVSGEEGTTSDTSALGVSGSTSISADASSIFGSDLFSEVEKASAGNADTGITISEDQSSRSETETGSIGKILNPSNDEAIVEETEKDRGKKDTASNDMIGRYVENGYENPAFDFKITLPSTYTLDSRAIYTSADDDVITASNSSTTYDWIRSQLSLGASATVFSATSDEVMVYVNLQGLGYAYDSWESEKVIAQNSAASYEDDLREGLEESLGSSVQLTDFEYEVDKALIAGKRHYFGVYTCRINGLYYYGVEIYMRSDDNQHVLSVDIAGFDSDEILNMASYIQELDD